MTFEKAIEYVGLEEGGFSLNKKDKGNYTPSGELKGTKYGISAKSYPNLDIKNLTWEKAQGIYLRDFWNKYSVNSFPPGIRLYLLDSIINHGPANGIKILQTAAGVKADGILGAVTLANGQKINAYDFAFARSDFYVGIVKRDISQLEFLKGWARRNLKILEISIREGI
ncbi:hypothetical protein MUK70_11775 [Dyadobacter chenwenxiniae]|uniref:Peptidoglycan binding protein n=1 Tax=Dyadobacter chenwenxiniae TaxID=2906456 RepID=A0A9X1TD47_9BACT|nr:glycosyl hydrolase 108 family protein [Dyadobacter chenwenxiniae]MCF0059920.1 hypothetical protein [Dyadobacter chenwenxiniae]UON85659.1 hypothetical protein MUK70_11775 [Dyadobacter chenwenxiniae]